MDNLERVTERFGAGRTKWVQQDVFDTRPPSLSELMNLLGAYFNGTTAKPVPRLLGAASGPFPGARFGTSGNFSFFVFLASFSKF